MKRWLRHVLTFPKKGYHYVPDIYGTSSAKQVDIRNNRLFFEAANDSRKDGRTLLYFDRLYTLYQAIENAARLVTRGETIHVAEIGAYKGGRSYFMAHVANALGLPIAQYAIDTFEGHDSRDLPEGIEGVHKPGLFNKTSFDDVRSYLSKFPFLTVIQGRIQDIAAQLPQTFDIIHLDVDIYEPTIFSLRTYGLNMKRGGIIVLDDYGFATCPGIRRAVDEFLKEHPEAFARFELLTGQCLLIKV